MDKCNIPIVEVFHLDSKSDKLANDFVISNSDEDVMEIILAHPVKINSIICAICVRGKARIQANLKDYNLEERCILILSPGTILQCDIEEISEEFLVKYFSFSPEFISSFDLTYLYSDVKDNPLFKANEEEYNHLLDLYSNILMSYQRKNHPFRRESLQHLLLSATYDFCAIYDNHIPYDMIVIEKRDLLMREFHKLIFKYYRFHRDTSFYANRLCLTPKYLSTIVKSQTGKTAVEWVYESIIMEAKALLKSSNMTIQELAFYFHFPDASTFGKFFKKKSGMTPREYRIG